MTSDEFAELLAGQKETLARLGRIEQKLDQQRAERGTQSIDQTDTVSILRMSCAERGIVITADGRIGENDAATLLGKASQTLQNWRYGARPLPYSKIGRTVTYHLQDLAAFLDGGKNDA